MTRVTRLMCAAAYLDGSFANYASRMVIRVGYRAVAPLHGVDVETLAQHVAYARGRRRRRDERLAAVALCMVLAYLVPVLGGQYLGIDSVWAVVLPMAGVLVGLFVAWSVVLDHYIEIYEKAKAVMDEATDPLDVLDAPPLPPVVMDRLGRLAECNAVVYTGEDPFVDSGAHVDLVKQRVDLHRRRRFGATPQPDYSGLVSGLHGYLLEQVPDPSLPPLKATSRVYIWGGIAADFDAMVTQRLGDESALMQDDRGFRRPGSSVPDAVLSDFLVSPAEWVRTYASFQQELRGGQIVISHHVRVHVEQRELFIEIAARVLPPLQGGFHDVETSLGVWDRERWRIGRQAAAMTPGLLLRGPRRWATFKVDPYRLWRERRDLMRRRNSGRPIDYGAASSLRVDAATGLDDLAHYQWVDTRRAVDLVQVQILDKVVQFLGSSGIDVSRLEQDVEVLRKDRSVYINRTVGSTLDLGRDDLVGAR